MKERISWLSLGPTPHSRCIVSSPRKVSWQIGVLPSQRSVFPTADL